MTAFASETPPAPGNLLLIYLQQIHTFNLKLEVWQGQEVLGSYVRTPVTPPASASSHYAINMKGTSPISM